MTIDFTNIMRNKTDYLSMEEITSMLGYCLTEEKIRDYMLILTLTRTGRRITEIVGEKPYTRKVGLRPCDIQPDGLIEFDILKKNHIKKRGITGKLKNIESVRIKRLTKMPRRVLKPVDIQFYITLKDYIYTYGIQSHNRVFPITRQRADMIIKAVALACKISRPDHKIHCHSFRHSYAIHLLKRNPNDAGVLRQVQELLDHSDINITMQYAQFTQYDKKETLNKTFEVE